MRILSCFALLLFLSASADNNGVWRESGENVTLRCYIAGCTEINSNTEYDGMYLYLKQNHKERKEVLYYHPYPKRTDKITPRDRYLGRIQTTGSLNDHTVTISRLTTDDSGFYSCVYTKFNHNESKCIVHTLFIKGVAPCSTTTVMLVASPNKKGPLVLIIGAACTICTTVTIIFTLLIVWACSRRRRTSVLQVSNEYVYETMTTTGRRPAQEQSSGRLHEYN
ncbi:hypothetical protein PBY51_020162 [Eleginops maclovinus]|uniref:Ig-like domain-containing protein n=2 Tax=Eleginops maclovinus TaxID=56733 RepID=A0AAN8AST6_ELEMC|nr:hypothetical protein PBY51_020162 [Eleginops maclovinus]